MVARGPRRLVPLATILVVGMTSCVAAGDEPTGGGRHRRPRR